jgi:hypothetical protein
MIFKELLAKYSDEDAINRVMVLYPDQQKNKAGYVKAIAELRKKRAQKTDVSIKVETMLAKDDPFAEPEDKDWIDICGKKASGDENWALDLTSWNEWLSMPITEESLKNFSELDILAHCLWEMTWHGYTNRSIQARMKDLKLRVDEIQEMEEKKKLT